MVKSSYSVIMGSPELTTSLWGLAGDDSLVEDKHKIVDM